MAAIGGRAAVPPAPGPRPADGVGSAAPGPSPADGAGPAAPAAAPRPAVVQRSSVGPRPASFPRSGAGVRPAVQRADEPAAPASGVDERPAPSGTGRPSGKSHPGDGAGAGKEPGEKPGPAGPAPVVLPHERKDLDDLARRLFPYLNPLLRAEMRTDRERVGLLRDHRF